MFLSLFISAFVQTLHIYLDVNKRRLTSCRLVDIPLGSLGFLENFMIFYQSRLK